MLLAIAIIAAAPKPTILAPAMHAELRWIGPNPYRRIEIRGMRKSPLT
jgi:hypothetical protein